MKYGYMMYDCTIDEMQKHKADCYDLKRESDPASVFGYYKFANVQDAVERINSLYVPMEHGDIPHVEWQLDESGTLLIKEITFDKPEDQTLYQDAVERAWALGGHLDVRVQQIFYD